LGVYLCYSQKNKKEVELGYEVKDGFDGRKEEQLKLTKIMDDIQ